MSAVFHEVERLTVLEAFLPRATGGPEAIGGPEVIVGC